MIPESACTIAGTPCRSINRVAVNTTDPTAPPVRNVRASR
ncbi:Uncharacterised protein [Mycobacteroides abscessus subsp. abscessus]|nr:Uncharacterised protein [Mycobacteroides abscessus subsp. abscessus]